MFRDKSNNVWIGTWGSGLFKLNLSDNTLQNYHPKDEYNSSFNSTVVVFIEEDFNGNLWFGTQGDGVFILEATKLENPKFKNYNSADGIPGDLIMGITLLQTKTTFGFQLRPDLPGMIATQRHFLHTDSMKVLSS